MDIYLDVDRTYASYYHLTIDHRGWAADACCGDSSWNPKWFVAVARPPTASWTAEAAISLAELGTTIVARQDRMGRRRAADCARRRLSILDHSRGAGGCAGGVRVDGVRVAGEYRAFGTPQRLSV